MDSDHPINDLLLRLDPSESSLLDWLRPHIGFSHLNEIAQADGTDEGVYFDALERIHQGEPIPVPLEWIPREVLNLKRWSDPGGSVIDAERTRGHLIRAFCCAMLLKAADEPYTLDLIDSEVATLIQGVASVHYLGKEASESALRFLSWRVMRLSGDNEEAPFFAMAVLLLYAALFKPGQDSTDLMLLADWVMAEEAQTRVDQGEFCDSEEWLLGLNSIFDQSHNHWRRVTQEVLLDPAKAFPEPAASTLRDIAKRLSG